MKCSNCNKEIPDGSEFCSYCGSKQNMFIFCYKCGKKIPVDSEFCQYCGHTLLKPETEVSYASNKKSSNVDKNGSKKLRAILIIAISIIVIAAAVIILVLNSKNLTKNGADAEKVTTTEEQNTSEVSSESHYFDMSIEDRIACSEEIPLGTFKNGYTLYAGKNLHISGYVIEDHWHTGKNIRIAESEQWPYDSTTKEEYYGTQEGHQDYDAWKKQEEEWEYTINKTPTVLCALRFDGKAEKAPQQGDYVDVYFVAEKNTKASAYAIVVRP